MGLGGGGEGMGGSWGDRCLKGHCHAAYLQINKELQSMREGRKAQTWGKGFFLKAVINRILKRELWICDRQEGVCLTRWGQDKDTNKWARVRRDCAHLQEHVIPGVWSEVVWKCVRMCMLINGQGLAEFAWGEAERARGSLEGSGMEHAGLSQCLSVGLIKG